jgi:hypothetical protein
MDSNGYDTTVKQEPEFLRVTLAGEFSVPQTLRAFDQAAEEARRHGASKVLIDARGVVGIPNDSQQYEVGRHFAAHARFKCALIAHPARRSYFGEWVAVTGGADIRLFLDEARAIAWLLKG